MRKPAMPILPPKCPKFFTTLLFASALFACDSDTLIEENETGEEENGQSVELSFRAMVGDQMASCDASYDGLGTSDATARIADARMFISKIELKNDQGDWTEVNLEDSAWQREGVVLLDFENGEGSCADSGNADTNDKIRGTLPEGEYSAVRFHLGLPFELNHLDNATRPSPFNVPGMFWAWQSGYKFFRVDWLVEDGASPRWNTHLGSTACESAAPTQAPKESCGRPNLATIQLDSFSHEADHIDLDLASLLSNTDLKSNMTDSPPGCMSSPGEADDCSSIFSALGMNFDEGSCEDGCENQTAFSVGQ